MYWLRENWFWVVILVFWFWMHTRMHAGHGHHGGHAGHRKPTDSDHPANKEEGGQHAKH